MIALARSHPGIFWGTSLISFLLSAFLIAIDPIINNDGMIYTAIAQRVLAGEWQTAISGFSLPAFSFIVAAISKLTTLDTETAAYLTTSIFACLTCLGFIAVVSVISGNDKRLMILAALIILLLPSISKYRSFITRDFAYLACYCWSLYYLLLYLDRRKLWLIVLSVALALISANFRLEGILFAALIPMVAINSPIHERSGTAWRQRWVWQAGLVILLAVSILVISDQRGYSFFSVFQDSDANLLEKIGLVFGHLNEQVESYESIKAILKMCLEIIRRMAVVFFILAAIAWLGGWPNNSLHRRAIASFACLNIAILCVFSMISGMAISRYAIALVLTLLVLAPFTLDKLLNWRPTRILDKVSKGTTALLIVVICLHGLNRPTDKHYLKEAGHWISLHANNENAVISNHRIIQFYSAPETKKIIGAQYSRSRFISLYQKNALRKYQIIAYEALTDNQTMQNVVQVLTSRYGEPVIEMSNQKNRKVYIYKTR